MLCLQDVHGSLPPSRQSLQRRDPGQMSTEIKSAQQPAQIRRPLGQQPLGQQPLGQQPLGQHTLPPVQQPAQYRGPHQQAAPYRARDQQQPYQHPTQTCEPLHQPRQTIVAQQPPQQDRLGAAAFAPVGQRSLMDELCKDMCGNTFVRRYFETYTDITTPGKKSRVKLQGMLYTVL